MIAMKDVKIISLNDLDFGGDSVLVRCDLDVDSPDENPRLTAAVGTVVTLLKNGAKHVVLIGHVKRPNGKYSKELSTHSLIKYFEQKLSLSIYFVGYNDFDKFDINSDNASDFKIFLLDNLRFWDGEKKNDSTFSKSLIDKFSATAYVNEAFGTAHRKHASIIGLPKLLDKKCVGMRFEKEVEILTKVLEDPKRPVVSLLSGVKEDKLNYIEPFKKFSDVLLIGGRLPDYMDNEQISVRMKQKGEKMRVADLNQDKEDITLYSIEEFEKEIEKAGTVVMAGPMGKYEDEGQRVGTTRILQAIKDSSAYKIAGGGDSEKAIKLLGFEDTFDWISTGGGAMLDFLANGTLPGIEVLID